MYSRPNFIKYTSVREPLDVLGLYCMCMSLSLSLYIYIGNKLRKVNECFKGIGLGNIFKLFMGK